MRRTAFALVAAALLVACGGDDDESTADTTADAPTSSAPDTTATPDTTTTPDPSAGDDLDACALLSAEALDAAAPDQAPWEEAESGPGTCTWAATDGATFTVTVSSGVDEVLDEVRMSSDGDRAVEDLDVFASGAVAVYDGEGTLVEAHAPAGADEVVAVIQDGVGLDEETMLGLLEEAALAWENRPMDGAESGDDEDSTGDASGAGVRFDVQSEGGGIDLQFEVTAEEVESSSGAAQVLCVGTDADLDAGIFAGTYTVMGLRVDTTATEGLVNASVTADGTVEGPGTYPGVFEAGDTDGRALTVEGDVTIDEGLTSGTFSGTDEAGNDVSVTFECVL